jgi:galactose mutarotase-like enzyme
MTLQLANQEITVQISGHGAELVSLVRGGREYLWNGDARYWNRHAPILFPAVGKPFNNEIRIDGQVLTMKQHGFARDCAFDRVGPGLLRMQDIQPENYPYRFGLEAQYRLEGSSVEITWTVENLDTRDIYAQIGAHPAFQMPDYQEEDPIHGYVRYYDAEGRPVSPVMVSGLDDGNRVPLPEPVRIPADMPVTGESFAQDALIFEEGQVASTVLCDKDGNPVLRVDCPQAEAYGIWAPYKPGCPFVCLEPWCGLCDEKGYVGDISGRTYVHRIAPGEKYSFTYVITVL